MKKFIFCISLVLTGVMTSCVDKYEEVDADSKPSWLGESIYAELKNANQSRLTGTFTNYVRLIDDLGYAETLSRTGSKTIFPANDEAFARFFANNDWGVSSYEQLSESQKKLLLYSSMLDNALLLGMLPNVSNGTSEPMKNAAVKHQTNVSVIDSVQFVPQGDPDEFMPKGNTYWDKYRNRQGGMYLVSDNTRPMLVHLTREYMLGKDISVRGDESDFSILTGSPYADGNAYVFNVGIQKNAETGRYNSDITCQNGYIHQMEDVIVPPGNLAQVLRKHEKTKYFSRIMDHYAMPYYDANTTRNYNDWAVANNKPRIDSIFQIRYPSFISQGGNTLKTLPDGTSINDIANWPNFDIGWNQYYPGTTGTIDATIQDMGAFFVPNDQVVEDYFLPGGGGAAYVDIYGSLRTGSVINDQAHLMENLDSIHKKEPGILAKFVNNLLQSNFSASVPSKFPNMTNDTGEALGLTTGIINRKDDGKYDITIANNGVLYVINEMIVPDEFNSVIGPVATYPQMSAVKWLTKDWKGNDPLNMDFHFLLMAMSANYAFFIPDNQAFDYYYLDPASLGHVDTYGEPAPEVLHFYIDTLATTAEKPLKCMRYKYDFKTGVLDEASRTEASIGTVTSQLTDILNYHTVVLSEGQTIGTRHYYKTKHGGTIYVSGSNATGTKVEGGLQKDLVFYNSSANQDEGEAIGLDADFFASPVITNLWEEKNGYAYQIDHVIQGPTESVYGVLKGAKDENGNQLFSEFLELCNGFESASDQMAWAGISSNVNEATGTSPQDAFKVFTKTYKVGATPIDNACLDYNVKMFNTYNYTLFAPDNAAMAIAYSKGLPQWEEIDAIFNQYKNLDPDREVSPQEAADKEKVVDMLRVMRSFIRYHFMTNSVYADETVEDGIYKSMSSNDEGLALTLRISGGGNQLNVTDVEGTTVTINANGSKIANKMTRDFWFDQNKETARSITTSSFCAVHQISVPLMYKSGNLGY